MPRNSRKKTSHIPKMAQFLKGRKNGHCRGYSQAKWSQMVYTGTEPQNTKKKYPLKSLELVYAENCPKTHLILEKRLNVEKW